MNNRFFLQCFAFLMLATGLPAGNAIRHYYEARKFSKTNQFAKAYALFDQTSREAAAENLQHYVFYASCKAAFSAYRLGRHADCIRHADLAVNSLDEHKSAPWAGRPGIDASRIEVLGLAERSSLGMRKNGRGWDYNRQAIAALQKASGMPVTPGFIDPEKVASLSRVYRMFGWRLIGRESEYLHLVGRTTEARELLAKALACAGKSANPKDPDETLYVSKLFNQLGLIESFVGYKKRAIELNNGQLALLSKAGPSLRSSWLVAKINFIMNQAELYGTTEESIGNAQAVLKEAKRKNPRAVRGMERMIIRLEGGLRESRELIGQLEKLSGENESAGDLLEAFHALRNAVFARSALGEEGLDSDFQELLQDVREKGGKKAEPRIYRRYGDWLARQGRYGEALAVYREALRMTRQFEWHPGVPLIQSKIASVFLADGQPDKAAEMWREMDAYVAAHPDIPKDQILRAWKEKMLILLEAGRNGEALQLAENARGLAKSAGLPEKWLLPFEERLVKNYIAQLEQGEPGKAETATESKQEAGTRPAALQPVAMTTVALAGTPASASFYLINHGSSTITGRISVSGPGIALSNKSQDNAPAFAGDPSKPEAKASAGLTAPAGVLVGIPVDLPPSPNTGDRFNIEITWSPETGTPSHSKWSVSWGGDATESVVLDAARLGLSPFVGIPVLHHVGFPDAQTAPQAIRLRSGVPVRIEYRDPTTGNLIAVDGNGNGNFTDDGDFFPPSAEGTPNVSAPRIAPENRTRTGSIEVWIYPHAGHPWEKQIEIPVELWTPKSGWTEYATNILKALP